MFISTEDAYAEADLSGSSLSTETTLEVVNWNMEWFGSPDQDPADDNRQQENALKVLTSYPADIYGLVEVVSEARLQALVSQMPLGSLETFSRMPLTSWNSV